jgi:hypothetical protein
MLEDIYNFLPLTETLLSSGMPTADQMAEVSKSGVELVTFLGMKYIGIPVEWEKPTRQNLDDFMDAMDANKENKILVHCQANYRATGFITLYRILRLGWDPKEAFKDLRRIWNLEDYPIWKKFMEENLIKNP